jgi:hypothetical protein
MKKLFLVSVILSGCVNLPPLLWYKDDATQEEFSRTRYECLQEAQQRQSSAYVNGNAYVFGNQGAAQIQGSAQSGAVTNGQLFGACMNAHGFYLQRSQS